jgi:hypothetical protein
VRLQHLRTLLWLRWRLTRNQWRRGGQVNAVLALIATIIGVGLAVAGGLGGVLAGALGLAHATPLVCMLVWDGLVVSFLFVWMLGLVTEIQRSEVIDPSRLMHLPISLREVFVLNYLASHVCLSLVIWVPLMLGLMLGLAFGRGALMLWLLPSILAFFFMVTAWTYCLRGWLAALMVNQRRRRAVVMGVTLFVIVLAQLPNLAMNLWRNNGRQPGTRATHSIQEPAHVVQVFTLVNRYAPPLWLPQGAQALQAGRVWPGLLAAAGMGLLGVLGLARAYRVTRGFYLGAGVRKGKAVPLAVTAKATGVRGRLLVERSLPLVPEPAAAVAFANLRSMLRAPEVKMALLANVVIFAILGAGIFLRHGLVVPEAGRPFVAIAAVYLTMLGMVQLLFNQFGFDRDGFRALVLLPALRWQILLGKNLALLAVGFPVFAVLLVLLAVGAHLGGAALVQAVLGFVAAFLTLSALGNWLSILTPYRIAAGSLKPTKAKASSQFLLVLVSMCLPVLLAPLVVPPLLGLLCAKFTPIPGAPVVLVGAMMLFALSALLYCLTLKPLGRLLQRREQRILQIVTSEVE